MVGVRVIVGFYATLCHRGECGGHLRGWGCWDDVNFGKVKMSANRLGCMAHKISINRHSIPESDSISHGMWH